MEWDSNTLPSTASVEVQQNKRQSLTNGTQLLQPPPWRNFSLCSTLYAPYTATTQTSSHFQRSHSQNQAVERRLGHQPKQADTLVPYNTALTMADTPIHLPSESNEESHQTKTPTLKSSRRINKLSDATPTSLSVTRASQGEGAIRDFDAFHPPHKAHQMRKWRIINKEQDDMHRYGETGSDLDGELPTTMPE